MLVDKLSGLLWFQVSGYFAKRAYRLQRRSPPRWSPEEEEEGDKTIGSVAMRRSLNGGDRHRLPAGIQTPPQRPAGCVSRKSKITKDSIRLKLCFPWVRGRGEASGIRQRARQGCCAGFIFPPPLVIDERCVAY